MNEKDKAKQLVEKYEKYTTGWNYDQQAKECAKICVEEIIEVVENIFESYEERNYWEGVLKEIDLI